MHAPQDPPDCLQCPRCGYEITPAIVAAEARGQPCGTCSECGLEITWSELRETGNDPWWFVESRTVAKRPRRRLLRAATTLAMCLRPFRFWSRVRMSVPTDRRGTAVFILLVALTVHCCLVARNIHTIATLGGGFGPVVTAVGTGWGPTGSSNPLDYVATALVPLSGVSVSDVSSHIQTQRGIRRIEPAGIVVLSARTTVAILEEPGLWPPAWFRGGALNADVPQHSTPLRYSLEPILNRRAIGRLACATIVPLTAPLAILLLPISMRRARVRPRHLVRCMVYSLALVVPIAGLVLLSPNGFGASATIGVPMFSEAHHLFFAAIPLTLVWNWAFARHYLMLEHPGAVAASNTVLAALVSLFVTYCAFGWL